MRIDFHAHTFPDKIADAALRKMAAAAGGLHPVLRGTEADLAESMREADIAYSVVLPVGTNPDKIAHINESSAAKCGKDGLLYFGCIHPDCADVKAELNHIVSLGLKGIKLHPQYQETDFDDIRFLRILDAAAERNLIAVTHAGFDIGYPGVQRCSAAMIQNALKQVEIKTLVLAHMGGWNCWDEVASLADYPVYLDTSFTLKTPDSMGADYPDREACTLSSEAFCDMVRLFGAKRILFGSDSPWDGQKNAAERIAALPLSEEEKAAILGDNGAKLLGL